MTQKGYQVFTKTEQELAVATFTPQRNGISQGSHLVFWHYHPIGIAGHQTNAHSWYGDPIWKK